MNKKLKIALVAISACAFAVLITGGFFVYKFKSEISKMAPVKTAGIFDDLIAVQDEFVNLYLVNTGQGYIAFDAGNNADNVGRELVGLNIDPSEVKAVFLTHSDWDHTKGISIFKNARIYASKAEGPMLSGTKRRMIFSSNRLDLPYELLSDGQVINEGNTAVRIIFTPGHTPGSACYLVNNKYLFTGDTLSLINGEIETFNEFFNMDTATEEQSIEKIKLIPGVKCIFTAHYGYKCI